jgi:hypothetical protein
MYILLRGHIRESFLDKNLYSMIKYLSKKYDIKIYIHTWNIIQSSNSWRKIKQINIPVTEKLVMDYFKDLSPLIKKIIIDDDTHISLIGNTQGFISLTKCPISGWKNMWYGMKKIMDYIVQDIDTEKEPILNLRFDILTNGCSMSPSFILCFLNNIDENMKKNRFAFNEERVGIDNIFVGNIQTMYNLINHFYYNLDFILKIHEVKSQEFLVFRENNRIF